MVIDTSCEWTDENGNPQRLPKKPTYKERERRRKRNQQRRDRDQIRRDCGLVKVKGALGGTYWE